MIEFLFDNQLLNSGCLVIYISPIIIFKTMPSVWTKAGCVKITNMCIVNWVMSRICAVVDRATDAASPVLLAMKLVSTFQFGVVVMRY